MKTHVVLSGSFLVGTKKPEIFQAFLGSCVGITLCDRESGIGGLIHLLLPEPPSIDASWKPEVSAATGLPTFIKALTRLGARKNRLEACIAGGALIDPLSKTDLILDIGGRTSEIAQKILEAEGIPVVKSEMGGYFSCRLSLNMATLESSIDPISIPSPPADGKVFIPPGPEQLDGAIANLLPIPQVALKIIRMIDNDSFSFRDIATEIIQDQVLSARILKLCNSVWVHSTMRVCSVEKALLRIGEKSLFPIALAVSMENFITYANYGYSLCKGGLFNHSIYTAGISRKMADITGKVSSDLAYTAGLLHDIGKVILDQYMSRAYPLFYRELRQSDGDLNAAEKEFFGISHTDAGHRLAQLWDLPESIAQVILNHHRPDAAQSNRELVHLIHAADYTSYRFMVGHDLEKMNGASLEKSLRAIDFDSAQFPILLATPQSTDFNATL